VGVERRCGDWLGGRLLLRSGGQRKERGNRYESERQQKCDRKAVSVRNPVIINFLHLDAFDSLGLCGVALRPAGQTGALLSVSRL